jgi:branched-chain amino acid transport system ATP-binding protein
MSLTVHDLAVSFGGVSALAGVSFAVEPGSITSLIGPNGAGKTTAFNAITGYVRPTAGEVRYEGDSLRGLRACEVAARGVVRTFQKTSVFPDLTAFENIMIGLHLRVRTTLLDVFFRRRRVRDGDADLTREAGRILEFVGLGAQQVAVASALAYGEQRLLELAIALAARPRLLLLDEPAAGMTGSEKMAVTRLIQKIRDQETTILLVEHDMRLVMGISDRVIVLNYGRVIATGSPDQVQTNPDVITAYLGSARADA